ncbi:MAG: hypothetical protein AAF957_03045 [Planctomycetota bacterium]
MFEPPRCPFEECPNHRPPDEKFYVRHGTYTARVHTDPVPRFRCRSCRRTFSRQTFRLGYRDKKPHVNARLAQELASGRWFRKLARDLHMTRNNVEKKSRKLFRHARHLNRNLRRRGPLVPECPGPYVTPDRLLDLQFDEYESYETRRNTRPVTIATAIESRSRFVIAMIVAPIRPHGRMTKQRLEAIAADEARFGPRQHLSSLACSIALRRAADFLPDPVAIRLSTDEKQTYPSIAANAFHGHRQIFHRTTSSRAPRGVGTALYPINHIEGKARIHMGRIQREMPFASKRRNYLSRHLELHIARRNWVRPRFYTDEASPAMLAGFAPRRMKIREMLGWRQDWGLRSPCPFGHGTRTVAEPMRGMKLAG